MEQIKDKLKQLRLSGALTSLESRNQYALEQGLSYLDFLDLVLEDERVVRANNAYKRRLKQSRLSQQKQLDTFDFSWQPEMDKKQIMDFASCQFIEKRENIVFMGKPGVGKTHLANGLGLEAVNKGYKVVFMHANSLIDQLHQSKAEGKYQKTVKKFAKADLLILDEVGFKALPQSGIDDFFEVIRNRYEQGSTIITTNRSFEDWGKLFGDKVMASAIIDRIVHHAHIIKITGESYRLKNAQNRISTANIGGRNTT